LDAMVLSEVFSLSGAWIQCQDELVLNEIVGVANEQNFEHLNTVNIWCTTVKTQ
jgi:hypothetical protein